MEKEKLFKAVEGMIISSTKNPKYVSLSPVKVADLYGTETAEVQNALSELVEEGRLKKEKLNVPPYFDVYMLP